MDAVIDTLIANGTAVIPRDLGGAVVRQQYNAIKNCHFVKNLDTIPLCINGNRWRGQLQPQPHDVGLGYGPEINPWLHEDDREVFRIATTGLEAIGRHFLDAIGQRHGIDLTRRYRIGALSDTLLVTWGDFYPGDLHPIFKPSDHGLLNVAMTHDGEPRINAGKMMLEIFALLGEKNVYPGCRFVTMPPGRHFTMSYFLDPSLDWFLYP